MDCWVYGQKQLSMILYILWKTQDISHKQRIERMLPKALPPLVDVIRDGFDGVKVRECKSCARQDVLPTDTLIGTASKEVQQISTYFHEMRDTWNDFARQATGDLGEDQEAMAILSQYRGQSDMLETLMWEKAMAENPEIQTAVARPVMRRGWQIVIPEVTRQSGPGSLLGALLGMGGEGADVRIVIR